MNRGIPSIAAEHDHTFAAITSSLFERKDFVSGMTRRVNARERHRSCLDACLEATRFGS